MKRALLLSGGLDSTAIAWWKRPETAIFVDHGQCAAFAERRAAEAVAAACGIEFVALRVDCSSLGSGQMAGREQLPEAPTPEWWPFRNQLLVTIAAAAALPKGVKELMIGTIADDGTNGDGTRAFVDRLDSLLRLQEGGMSLNAPALDMTAVELLSTSGAPQEVLGWCHSCFVSDIPCMKCRGCIKQLKVLEYTGRRWACL